MKKITVLLSLAFILTTLQAQNYLISFAGSGAASTVDSVKVENITQGTRLNMSGADQLNLLATLTGIIAPEKPSANPLQIFPNPALEEVTARFNATADDNITIDISDQSGRLVATKQVFLQKGRHAFHISGLASGVYILLVKSENDHYAGKILSQSSAVKNTTIDYQGQVTNPMSYGNVKASGAVIQMQYTFGDRLKFTGKSGDYRTIYMDVPTENKTITFGFVACTDGDGNHYTVVKIGNAVWMAENLKTTKYNDGSAIPLVTNASSWSLLTTPGYCWYNNDATIYKNIFGGLYNWYAASSATIAPVGWRVATDTDWTVLASFLGGDTLAGGKMKEPGEVHWFTPNVGATNESGLTVIAGGFRLYNGLVFDGMGYGGSFWSKTGIDAVYAWNRDIFYYNTIAHRHGTDKKGGLSIRCVKN